ncbi:Serine/arginine repetitive matrix protein 2 putative isoform 2 [Tripterygium wilfordii]|uniref:Serine/arginine repetitive matrix protein 2 putative isoform 2 n=1 Tax=Tripterygium wilfordii TaxID=458696 RepID=A0A7J7CYY1_TRIWF|nr:uncharacterized protein LOC120011143 [Tripterygium wilfordii]KAF5739228.1 Serine/arginine repetitive matrix protein 2 putative isoform 2 [Tripterygium wilfordii]
MAWSLSCYNLTRLATVKPPSRLVALRFHSNQPYIYHQDLSSEAGSTSDPLLQRLEDAIHRIIVKRSAPDWLPFIPGSSYWVPPPRSQSYGIAQLVEKLANPMTDEETMSTTTVRGCPSADYFVKGAPPHSVQVEMTSKNVSQSEDEEG